MNARFAAFASSVNAKFAVFENSVNARFAAFEISVNDRFNQINARFVELEHRIDQIELQLLVKLSMVMVTSITVATAVLGWLIKAH